MITVLYGLGGLAVLTGALWLIGWAFYAITDGPNKYDPPLAFMGFFVVAAVIIVGALLHGVGLIVKGFLYGVPQ